MSGNAIGARRGDGVHRLTALLIRAKRDGLGQPQQPTAAAPPRDAHDAQTTTLRVRLGAVTHTFTVGADASPVVVTYVGEVAKAFGLEL